MQRLVAKRILACAGRRATVGNIRNVGHDAAASMQAISQDGYTVARLGATSSVRDMEKVALHLMQIDDSSRGNYNGMGGVKRNTIEDTSFVDSAAGAPAEVTIQFHNEMAYATSYPKYVTFAMVKQADEDGTTLLADNLKVQESMSSALLLKFRELGVQYIRYLHDESDSDAPDFYTSWQGAFLVDTIEAAMAKGNDSNKFSILERYDERRLRHTLWCPVFHEHPKLGNLFFNSVLNRHASWLDGHSYWDAVPYDERPYHCLWGDGTPFSDTEMGDIRDAYEKNTIAVGLDPGDVLVLDNLRIVHGRNPYKGDQRLLGLLLSDMVSRDACEPPSAYKAMMDRKLS